MDSVIKIRGIIRDFKLGQETVHVLKGIDLDIERGEYLAIMGASGSGKSTLMNILGCLDTATAGTYILNNKDVSELSDDEFPPQVVFLSHDCAPFTEASHISLLQGRQQLCIHVDVYCDEGETQWAEAVQLTELAKEVSGLKVKALLHAALEVDALELSHAAALLGDAGADILTISVSDDADTDDLDDAVEAMRENDILGVPMAMRIGMRIPADCEDAAELVAHAVENLEVFHFDVCPLGKRALKPAMLAAAVNKLDVDSQLCA